MLPQNSVQENIQLKWINSWRLIVSQKIFILLITSLGQVDTLLKIIDKLIIKFFQVDLCKSMMYFDRQLKS